MSAEKTSWDLANAWTHYNEPARPNCSEVEIVEQYIDAEMKVLLLGSTPEYRDLFSQKQCNVTIVDFSKENYHAMTSLMSEKPYCESFVQADWRDMQIDQQFDLVLGDHVFNLLPFSAWLDLLNKIKSSLNKHAYFLQRIIVRPETYDKELPDIFRGKNTLSNTEIFSQTFYDLLFLTLDSETESTNLQKIWEQIMLAKKDDLISDIAYEHFIKFNWQDMAISAYFPTRAFVVDMLAKVFQKTIIKHGALHYSDYTFFTISQN